MKHYIGIDIGGTTSRVTLGFEDHKINILNQSEVYKTSLYEPFELIDKFIENIHEFISITEGNILSIGISCGGPLNSKTGTILSPPNLPGWDNINICEYISSKVNLPTWLCNDANAGALAEWKYGAGQGSTNMVFMTFGTGLGAGLILNGKLYSGTNDMAGELGHIRLSDQGPVGYGKRGSFEGYCSGGGIAQSATTYALEARQSGKHVAWDSDNISAKDVGIAAQNNDPDALKVFHEVGTKLGQGTSVLIDILNPDTIVIGSIYQRNENILKPLVWEEILKETLPLSNSVCEIKPSLLNESIGDISALTVASYYDNQEDRNER